MRKQRIRNNRNFLLRRKERRVLNKKDYWNLQYLIILFIFVIFFIIAAGFFKSNPPSRELSGALSVIGFRRNPALAWDSFRANPDKDDAAKCLRKNARDASANTSFAFRKDGDPSSNKSRFAALEGCVVAVKINIITPTDKEKFPLQFG